MVKKTSNTKKSVGSIKKQSVKSNIVESKPQTDELKRKRDELINEIESINLLSANKTFVEAETSKAKVVEQKDNLLDVKQKTSGIEWLEEENNKLMAANEQLKIDYKKIYNDYQILKNGGSKDIFQVDDYNTIKKNVQDMYNEFKYALSRGWVNGNIPKLMEKMKNKFNFLV